MTLKAKILLAALMVVPLVAFGLATNTASAQSERSYRYSKIFTEVYIKPETTVDISETQTYRFIGEYHLGWRSIPHNKIDAVSDVSIVDEATGRPMTFSRSRLNKLDPKSWGSYTVFNENGATNIEWYYDLGNSSDPVYRTWTLHYTVHGAISFLKDHDELYWNLFTDYDVPVDSVEATITLPQAVSSPTSAFYTTGSLPYESSILDDRTFYFSTTNVAPQEDVTFAVGWQKGMIDRNAYWRDAAKIYWQIIAAVLLLIVSIGGAIAYRKRQEYLNRGRGTIVPQYEPPQKLPPAMAEVVSKTRVSTKAWPATVIDLAVRKFVTIEEKKSGGIFGWFKSKDYVVTRINLSDEGLEEYEKDFLSALFPSPTVPFSTYELSTQPSRQRALAVNIDAVTKKLYEETQADTNAFAVSPNKSIGFKKLWRLSGYFLGLGLAILFLALFSQMVLVVAVVVGAVIVLYVVWFLPLLNKQGSILREEWLGFKMFLEVTGKDRMQNLTPDMFEKYLPYAMIFGVEKAWAKKFESINLRQPDWYTGNSAAFVSPGGGAGTFSPSSFATGFSASFASSFASSGGGGASGGGGGAGGGGGGGGGGAS